MIRWANYLRESAGLGVTLAQRCLHKMRSAPVHAYIGWFGHRNVGDESVFAGMKRVQPDVRWLPAIRSTRGIRLAAHVGLDGPNFFRSTVLGGGTMISSGRSRDWVEELLRLGQPLWACGTGVGSAGWSQTVDVDLRAWSSLLNDFKGIAVRGPKSKERLESVGVRRVEICGDAALALARNQPGKAADPPALAINLSAPLRADEGVDFDQLLALLVRAAKRWSQRGGRILPFAMDRADMNPLRQFCKQIEMAPANILFDLDPDRVIDALGRCAAVVGVRLHSAVFATCVGLRPVLLGYRDKCLDFMLSMGLEDAHVGILNNSVRTIEERLEGLLSGPAVPRTAVLDRAKRWARVQREYSARMIDEDAA